MRKQLTNESDTTDQFTDRIRPRNLVGLKCRLRRTQSNGNS